MAKELDKNITEWQGLKIRTMRKDIAWIQSGGHDIEKERSEKLKKEERQKRMKEEQERKAKEEQRIREEAQRKTEEERMRFEETQRRTQDEMRKWEEESKRIKEQKKKTEEERWQTESIKIEEEKRKREEGRKEREGKSLEEKAKIELNKEKIRIQEELQKISEEKKPLELNRLEFLEKLKPIEKAIGIITRRQKIVEDDLEKIEEKERSTESLKERRGIEKKRWEFEEKRRKTEEERWPWDEEKKKIETKIQEIDFLSQEILKKEALLKERQGEILAMEERTQLEKEKERLKNDLQKIEEDKKTLEAEKQEVYKSLVEFNDNLKIVLEKERKTEEDIMLIKEEQELVKEEEEKRRLEKERREMEEKRREIEKERWKLEEEKNDTELRIKKLEDYYQKILEKGANIIDKIKEIDARLMPPEKEKEILDKIRERIEEAEKKTAVDEADASSPTFANARPVEEPRVKEKPVVKEDKSSSSPFAAARVIEALTKKEAEKEPEIEKESETRTEVERRRREKEKQRITQEQKRTEEEKRNTIEERRKREILERIEKEREEFLERMEKEENKERVEKPLPAKSTSGEPLTIIRPVPEKHSFKERMGMRIAILILLLMVIFGITIFWYWFLKKRGESPSFPLFPQEEVVTPESKKPEIVIPSPLFSTDDTAVLSVSSSGELRNLLLQEVRAPLNIDQFKRVVIKNINENKVLGLRDFFEALLIRAPEELYSKLENDFTLFVYAQSEGNRIGFATKIKNSSGLNDLLKSRESTMQNDFQAFFELVDKQATAIVPYFRNASNVGGYTGPNFRYQTLAREDLGICYLIAEDYFVFTSSWKSMEKTITKLALYGKPLEITGELKLGNSGNEVELLQTWLKQEPVVYPEGKVTGYFGELTQAAVIRFQEKYASEILAPQGFSKGTGIVDSYTRIKLNEIYGKSGIMPTVPEITTDLRYGDHGNEVKLLQAWLAKDHEIYPEGNTSSWFGYATQRAVIRFQEKYASEILTPQGLSRGTGIVDALTRKKLNELYGNK